MLREQVQDRRVLQALRKRTIHHPLVRHSLLAQAGVERKVERQQQIPDAPELLLVLPARLEMGKEGADGLHLLFFQIGEVVLQGTEVGDVGEQLAGIDQVFVHVVEIREQHPAPEDELVQAFRPGAAGLIEGLVAIV